MEPPNNWLKMIENIRRVRQKYPAPVDSMGCDQTSDKRDSNNNQRFQVLVSLMLSSQTKDPITWAAVQKLKERGMAHVGGIVEANEKDIEDAIYPVGFYRRKAIYLKKVASILALDYNGDIPASIKELCNLPGVGPKMAHLCMQEAWGVNSGIGVDTHVHRIAARLGWVPSKGIKTPEDTRKALESWLPRDYWREINHLLVGFGQTICTPIGPKCKDCDNNVICPSAFVKSSPTKKKRKPVDKTIKIESLSESNKIIGSESNIENSSATRIKHEPIEQESKVIEKPIDYSGQGVKIEPHSEEQPKIRIKLEPIEVSPPKEEFQLIRRSTRVKQIRLK